MKEGHILFLFQYNLGSLLIFGIGYPISQALVLSLMSKTLGSMPQVYWPSFILLFLLSSILNPFSLQSTIMGLMASLGSVMKIVGAVVAGWAFQAGSTAISVTFYVPGIALSATTIAAGYYFWNIAKQRKRSMLEP